MREQPSWSSDVEPYPPLSVRHGSRGNVSMETDMTFHGTDDIDCHPKNHTKRLQVVRVRKAKTREKPGQRVLLALRLVLFLDS